MVQALLEKRNKIYTLTLQMDDCRSKSPKKQKRASDQFFIVLKHFKMKMSFQNIHKYPRVLQQRNQIQEHECHGFCDFHMNISAMLLRF